MLASSALRKGGQVKEADGVRYGPDKGVQDASCHIAYQGAMFLVNIPPPSPAATASPHTYAVRMLDVALLRRMCCSRVCIVPP